MSVLAKLRTRGFEVRLTDDQYIAIKPADQLPDDWRNWISGNRQRVIRELQAEAANDSPAELRQCSQCKHDRRSPYNPTGGLTACDVRRDVPMMVWSARKLACAQFLAERSFEPP